MDNEKGDLCSTDMQTGTCGNLWMISLGIYLWAECPRVGVCVCVCLNGGGCGGGAHTLKSLMYIGHVGEKERVDETIFRTTQHP